MTIRAIGGAPLEGNRLVRAAYLDEAGIDRPQTNPNVVVAGIVLHTDTQWRLLKEHFAALKEELRPDLTPAQREVLVFHATDIWHGVRDWPRAVWSLDQRAHVLRELCRTIVKFNLPIVWGQQPRAQTIEYYESLGISLSPAQVTQMAFTLAFWMCVLRADQWMNMKTTDEFLSLQIENNNELQRHTKVAFRFLNDPQFSRFHSQPQPTKIVDAPSFMEKQDAPALQLADTCAFLLKRGFNGDGTVWPRYLGIVAPQISAALTQEEVAHLAALMHKEREAAQ